MIRLKVGLAIVLLLAVVEGARMAYAWCAAHPTVLGGVAMFATILFIAVFGQQPQRRTRVDDFGNRPSAAHPYIVPVSVAAPDMAAEIERVGADVFLSRCQLIAGPCPDPGHPGSMPIALWQPPESFGSILVLECFNGTRGPDGRFERLAKGVSAQHHDPLSAAAASYGVTADVYRSLARRV